MPTPPEASLRVRSRALIRTLLFAATAALAGACAAPGKLPADAAQYDVIIRGGTIYDGSGNAPFAGDVALAGDRVAAIGDLGGVRARHEIDAAGLAVAPGFINMLSWATESLLVDPRSESDIRQGVTLEVFGEGWSMGPLNAAMKQEALANQGDLKFDIEWTTLGGYLEHLERRGISTNVASFVGATTVRIHELGHEDRAPTPAELERMRQLVREAMEQGALGVGSSLIYAPAFYSSTDELVALAQVAAEYGGAYTSHMRSEGARLLEAIDELIEIARRAGIRANIYHLKAAGVDNWDKFEAAIAKIEAARAQGLRVTADMYPYVAGSTGLNAVLPPWLHEGGTELLLARLGDPAVRERVAREMTAPTDRWENLYVSVGSPDNILLVGFRNESLKPLAGKTLAEVAALRGQPPEQAAIDLVLEDNGAVEAVYFMMSEENVRRGLALPWVAFCSDAASQSAAGVFLQSHPHPRTYGAFARILGRYVREQGAMSLADAIRRLSAFPAETLGLSGRGRLAAGYFADVVIFDPDSIIDHATFAAPHRYASGVRHVFVNGEQVLADGAHTGATPGRFVRGPGWTGRDTSGNGRRDLNGAR